MFPSYAASNNTRFLSPSEEGTVSGLSTGVAMLGSLLHSLLAGGRASGASKGYQRWCIEAGLTRSVPSGQSSFRCDVAAVFDPGRLKRTELCSPGLFSEPGRHRHIPRLSLGVTVTTLSISA